ncbi:MAG TPA: SDR family NAD(P)-dependent oxidoreductase [Microbacteriaceae bacterium]|nr:SDR family NAD(P)-dependent oxidoreductase [Microbacteriaceae bacterium]
MTDLAGKRILVTGATGVLGGLITRQLASRGASIVASGQNETVLAGLTEASEHYAVDLAVPGAVDALVQAISADGGLDGVVIAHGVVAFGGLDTLTDDTLQSLVTLNQTVPMQLVRAALPVLTGSAAHGNTPFVVTISGVISELPTMGMAAYGASKAGLLSFVKATQRELKRAGIRLLDARPPHTETGLAGRAIAGTAPNMAAGLEPQQVASRIVDAIVNDEVDVPTSAFTVS